MIVSWKFAVLAALVAAVAHPALAQSPAAPAAMVKTSDMSFGAIVKPSSGSGTVTVGAGADTVALTGKGTAALGPVSRAKFNVGGEGGQASTVTVPPSFVMSSGGHDLTVTLTSSATPGALDGAAASDTLQVGGAFTLGSTQPVGAYVGSFAVITAYN